MTKQEFKGKLKKRLAFDLLLAAVMLIVTAGHFLADASAYMSGFISGLSAVIVAYALIDGFRTVRAMKDEEKLDALFRQETDERIRSIQQKAVSTAMTISLFTLLAAVVVSGFFNQTVYVTLLSVTFALSIVSAACKLYYFKKM